MPTLDTLEGYALLPIDELHESKLNPRKHFDAAALQELAVSIAAKGVLTPLLVRPQVKAFEVGAGHRRLRAAKIAGLGQLPCVVRQMSDADFLELIVVENDQREDVHPLEQAEGYKRLMLLDGYDAKRIAGRIGRSEKFVYDRMKLLGLIPKAQQLFLAGRMSAGHAILLARLNAKDQERALEVPDHGYNGGRGGLWQDEGGVYLHHLLRSDADRHLHDHPWAFWSLILWGGYDEFEPLLAQAPIGVFSRGTERMRCTIHRPLRLIRHAATDRHQLGLVRPAWSLIWVGRRSREWGFYTESGWVPWQEYTG